MKRKILSVETSLSTYTHIRTHRHPHLSILTIQNLIYTPFKQTTNWDLRWRKTAVLNRKCGRLIVSEKRHVLRFDLKESRKGFCQTRRGSSFHVEGPKTEKAQEPTAESLLWGIWRLLPIKQLQLQSHERLLAQYVCCTTWEETNEAETLLLLCNTCVMQALPFGGDTPLVIRCSGTDTARR